MKDDKSAQPGFLEMVIVMVVLFSILAWLGLWEAPTPENIRKLDAEIEAMGDKP